MKPILPQIKKTHAAAKQLQQLSNKAIQQVLYALADELEGNTKSLLKANAKDLARQSADNPKNDRLQACP